MKNNIFKQLSHKLLGVKMNANSFKRSFAWRRALLGLCIFAISATVFAVSVDHSTAAGKKLDASALFAGTLVAFEAGKKGTKKDNGHDETDIEFAARKGAAESDEAFFLRKMQQLVAEGVKTAQDEFKAELTTLQEKLDKLKPSDAAEINAIKGELRKHGLDIISIKDITVKDNKHKSAADQLVDFLTEKKDNGELKNLFKHQKLIEFTPKVAGTMTTGSVAVPESIPTIQGVQVAPPTNVNLRRTIIDSVVSMFATSLSSYAYTESLPKDGDFAFLAEAAIKTEVDFKIETRYANPKKIAAFMKLTEESVTDIPGLQSIAYGYLRAKHDLKRQYKLLFGAGLADGTGDEPRGATLYAGAWGSGSGSTDLAGQVIAPNIMDVINAMATAIYNTHNYTDEMPYEANLCLMNPSDFYVQLVSAKTSFGTPLYPQASLFTPIRIGSCMVMPLIDIPVGKIFVADMSRYNVSDYVPYTIKIGWVNDDFIYNQFVILGESRLHAYVKKLDRVAFLYDDIATIKAAITGSNP